jgi:capsular polysaccharide transport system permease protein
MFGSDNPLVIQARVIWAIVLRDLRTRFGRTGSILWVAWPLGHLAIIMTVGLVVHKALPALGADPAVFVGTGLLPYILFLHPGREIMLSLMMNKPLLSLPAVTTTDIILARCILQIIVGFWVACLFLLCLYIFDIDVVPHRIEDAILAILSTVYLGLAIGWVGAVMYAIIRLWLIVQIGLLIGMYVTSGIFFIPTSLPEQIRNILWYNPLIHSVEWLRSAYYDGYGYGMLSRTYLLVSATLILFVGLLLERGIRGRLLER